jgi:probable F420-dependent oxidoreductase
MRRISVGLGMMGFPFSGTAAFWRWVDLCEEGGVDSLWQTDRLIGRDPHLECVALMAALAGRTRRMKFGMNVVSLVQRDPVLVAKQCATIDMLSEGRLLPAFGLGSDRAPEWDAMDLDRRTRGARMDEALEIVKRLWAEDSVDFNGQFYRLRNASISPRPMQAELPMWIGGAADAAIRRTARFGTGWQGGAEAPLAAGRIVAAVQEELARIGRTIDEDHYGVGFPFRFGTADDFPELKVWMQDYRDYRGLDPMTYYAIGDADTIVSRIAEYVDAGVSKFILRPIARGDMEMMAQTRRLIAEVLPKVKRRWPRIKTAERRQALG